MYTIGQVSEMFDLPISTLRYYDKQGLFPEMTGYPASPNSMIPKLTRSV